MEPAVHRLGPLDLPQCLPGRGEVLTDGASESGLKGEGWISREVTPSLPSYIPLPCSPCLHSVLHPFLLPSFPPSLLSSKPGPPRSARTCSQSWLIRNQLTKFCRRYRRTFLLSCSFVWSLTFHLCLTFNLSPWFLEPPRAAAATSGR